MEHRDAVIAEAPTGLRPSSIGGGRIVRDLKGLGAVLARAGSLELRLATTKKEIRKLQRLRYHIFYEQGDALPDSFKTLSRRDKCPFDRICDHLMVVDTGESGGWDKVKSKVVGTYRFLRTDMAASHHGFYSETEFDLDALMQRHADKRFLELGRSCVHADYRSKRVIDLLWHGIGIYAAHHGIDVLIGCSSLRGAVAETLAVPLSFAFHHAAAPAAWQVEAVAHRAVRMDWLDKAAFDPRRAMASLPPLMKAYVRAGGAFASQAAVDHEFGTTDLFTILPLASGASRYMAHFQARA